MAPKPNNYRPVILHLLPTLEPDGGELQLLHNLQQFSRSKFEHVVVYIRPSEELLPAFEKLGLRVVCLDPKGRSWFIKRAFKLARFLRKNNVALIHTTNAEADKLGAVAGFLARVPIAATLNSIAYDDEWFKKSSGLAIWKLWYMKYTRKFALRLFVKKYNAVSGAVEKSFGKSLGLSQKKIEVIYRGVDTKRYERRPEPRVQPGNDGAYPRMLTVGRLVGEKGHRFAIEAMVKIRQRYPNAELHIAGMGYMRDTMKKQISDLQLADSVKLLGHRSDIPNLLRGADIFVFPSLSEGCPNALLEAMAVGLPCVAAASDAVAEILTDHKNALLTELRDSSTIAEAVLSLADDREKAEALGEAAADLISSRFSIKQSAEALEKFYSQILELPERIPAKQASSVVTK